jgi:hypothetical protein
VPLPAFSPVEPRPCPSWIKERVGNKVSIAGDRNAKVGRFLDFGLELYHRVYVTFKQRIIMMVETIGTAEWPCHE